MLHEARWWQIRALIRGYYRRHRVNYESAQWLSNAIGAMFSGGENTFPGHGEPWPWNRKENEERNRREAEKSRAFIEQIRREEQERAKAEK